jgi:hypothetical protein
MNSKTEIEVAEELLDETPGNSEAIELALTDLDLIGGGSVGMYFH